MDTEQAKIIFWRCPYLKMAYKKTGPYCMLHKEEFGRCDKCEVYNRLKKLPAELRL